MKALLLVGGYGTRLRPVTLTIPKPLVTFCNKSILEYQIEALVKVGVNHVILAVSHKQDAIMNALSALEKKYEVKIDCSIESVPLGTAGPIRHAEKLLTDDFNITDPTTPFFVLNSDIISEFPFSKMLELHAKHKREGTIVVTTVSDPSKFGVVIYNEETLEIHEFIEKPQIHTEASINAGIYLFNLSVIQRIPDKETSIEKVIFPILAKEGQLYALKHSDLWMDVGNPHDYLHGMISYLKLKANDKNASSHEKENIIGSVVVHPEAKIHPEALIGPNVTIGPRCIINKGCRLQNCAIFEEVVIEENVYVKNAIISNSCHILPWSRIEGLTVLGENVTVQSEIFIRSAFILPHKNLNENIYDIGRIIM